MNDIDRVHVRADATADVDPRLYRTELLAPGPHGVPPEQWTLSVDGHLVACSAATMSNDEAQAWARRQLGEGVRFLPVMFDDLAATAIARGRRIDWVANPDQRTHRPRRDRRRGHARPGGGLDQ